MISPLGSVSAVSRPLTAAEADRAAGEAVAVQDVGGGQGRVSAQSDLGGGGEPPQRPVGFGILRQRMRVRGLGEVHLGGDPLKALVGGEAEAGAGGVRVQEDDGGGIARIGVVGEGVDSTDPHGPGR